MKKDKNKKKKKNSFFRFVFKILFFLILITFGLYFFLPHIVLINKERIVDYFFKRNIIIKSYSYNPLKTKFIFKEVILKNKENLDLLSIDELIIDFDLVKFFTLKPTISNLHIISPKTFLIKNSQYDYTFPKFVEMKQKDKKKPSNISIDIQQITLLNGKLDLLDKKKLTNLLTELKIELAGINTKNNKEITPIISGKFINKSFNIKGKTIIEESALINQFDINLKKFNIESISSIIPNINSLKIVSGEITADAKITFITHKNKKPELKISGFGSVNKLYIFDTKTKKNIFENIWGNFKINHYNVFKNTLDIDNIKINSGTARFRFSKDSKLNSSIFTGSSSNRKQNFNVEINNSTITKSLLIFEDIDNRQNLTFIIDNGNIKNFIPNKDVESSFQVSTTIKEISNQISFIGYLNLKRKYFNFSNIKIDNLILSKIKVVTQIIKNIQNCNLKKYDGKIEIINNNIIITGKGEISDFYYKKNDIDIGFSNLIFDINKIDINKREYNINGAKFIDGYYNNSEISIKKANFIINQNNIIFNTIIDNKNNVLFLNQDLILFDISGEYKDKLRVFNFFTKNIVLNKDFRLIFNDNNLFYSGDLALKFFVLNHNNRPTVKIDSLNILTEKISLIPLTMNINKIDINNAYITLDIRNDNKLYLFSFEELKFSNKETAIKLNIDSVKINNSSLLFSDFSLDKTFSLDISKINGEIKNFPSFVYPEGDIIFEGIINKRNILYFNTKICTSHIKGNIKTENLVLSQFNPYFDKYIGYNVNTGFVNIDSFFEIKNNLLDSQFDLVIQNFMLTKTKNLFRADLSKIVPLIENDNGKIELSIPVNGKWGEPNIDFRKIFFSVFYDILDKSQTSFSDFSTDKFIKDETIEIIYFSPGSDNFIINKSDIFSDDMKSKFNNKNKYFVIEGYVDIALDTPYLKREKLNSIISSYKNEQQIDEEKILAQIYENTFNKVYDNNNDTQQLYNILIDKIELENTDYYSLSFRRMNKIKDILVSDYLIDKSRISFSEKNIKANPYIKGVGNSITVLLSGNINQ